MSCVDFDVSSNKMGFIWSETSGGHLSGSLASTKNPRALSIAKDTLIAETTYVFEVIGYMIDDPNINSTATVEVNVKLQDIIAIISGGTFQQYGSLQAFTLGSSSSYDPDNSAGTLSYYWSCAEDTTTTADCSGLVVPTRTTPTLSVGAGKLTAGEYTFTLLAKKGSRNDTATVTVEITTGTPPIISITAPTPNKYPAKYNADDLYLSLTSTVTSSLDYTSKWTFDTSDVKKPFEVSGNAKKDVKNDLTAVLGVYGFTGGDTYVFRLTATDSDGFEAYSTVSIVMNKPPTGGAVEVEPINGYALETSFTFTAVRWTEEDIPITYIFGTTAVNADGSLDTSFLSPFGDERGDASYTGLTLAQGHNSTNFTVGAYAQVIDYYGAIGSDYTSIRVASKTLSTEKLANITETKTEKAISSGNPESSRQVLTASNREMRGSRGSAGGDVDRGKKGGKGARRALLGTGNRQGTEAALRASNLVNLWATYDITTITSSDVASLLTVLVGILDIPDEVTYDVASGAHFFLHTV